MHYQSENMIVCNDFQKKKGDGNIKLSERVLEVEESQQVWIRVICLNNSDL